MIMQLPSCVRVLGVRVHTVRMPDVVALMEHWIEAERSKCHHVVNTGMHGIMEARNDADFKDILNAADLFFPDGISLIRVLRRRGFTLKKRDTGPELMREFCKLAARKGYKNFFYGDAEGTLQSLAARLKREFPDLKIVGFYSPPFRPLTLEEDAGAVRMINEADPDVLWVALGCPNQERWIFEHKNKLKAPVAVGVGAAFKFLAGQVKRAPPWVGECGLEWLWRFAHEPRRLWHRVFVYGPQFIAHTLLELSGLRNYD